MSDVPSPTPETPAAGETSAEVPAPRRRRLVRESVLETMRRWRERKTDWKRLAVTTGFSAIVHAIVLIVCALIVIRHPAFEEIFSSVARFDDPDSRAIIEQAVIQPEELVEGDLNAATMVNAAASVADVNSPVALDVNDLDPSLKLDELNVTGLKSLDLSNETSGRSAAARAALVKRFGGNSASEAAVASGLKWLKQHQFPDGGWSFDHAAHPGCDGKCSQSGAMTECRIAATGMALLSYLGGGHTSQSGDYQQEVKRGLDFLVKSGKLTSSGLDLRGELAQGHAHAAFYSQGIATIALCEAFALTRDPKLGSAAQNAANFIMSAQDPREGGWRYTLQQAGDTSVVGWQVMALKSAQNAGLQVPPQVFIGAERFLNIKQSEQGSQYAYLEPDKPTPAMTAVGLLCRMYLGWGRRDGGLRKGVVYLDRTKPSRNNMYYNYYATQVMHHWGGDEWNRWNEVMRDYLVNTQHRDESSHLAGSWDLADPHGSAGGRLYMTCLAVMTLEVYYRHLPIYQREKLKVEF